VAPLLETAPGSLDALFPESYEQFFFGVIAGE
jgi:hypothetical protein